MTGFLWASLVVDVCNRTLLFADSQPRFKETLHIYVTLCSLSQRCSSQKRIKTGYKDALIGPRMPSPARVSLQKDFKLISQWIPIPLQTTNCLFKFGGATKCKWHFMLDVPVTSTYIQLHNDNENEIYLGCFNYLNIIIQLQNTHVHLTWTTSERCKTKKIKFKKWHGYS